MLDEHGPLPGARLPVLPEPRAGMADEARRPSDREFRSWYLLTVRRRPPDRQPRGRGAYGFLDPVAGGAPGKLSSTRCVAVLHGRTTGPRRLGSGVPIRQSGYALTQDRPSSSRADAVQARLVKQSADRARRGWLSRNEPSPASRSNTSSARTNRPDAASGPTDAAIGPKPSAYTPASKSIPSRSSRRWGASDIG